MSISSPSIAAQPHSQLDIARSYTEAGMSVFPLDYQKWPYHDTHHDIYHHRLPTDDELRTWFGGPENSAIAIALGAVSGNIQGLRIWSHDVYANLILEIDLACPGLFQHLTVLHGRFDSQILFRSETVHNCPLARFGEHPSLYCHIEARGNGNYAIAPGPTTGPNGSGSHFLHIAGPPLTDLSTVTSEQLRQLWKICQAFNDSFGGNSDQWEAFRKSKQTRVTAQDFNARAQWEEILEPHGWTVDHTRRGRRYWHLPDIAWSATTGHRNISNDELLCVYSEDMSEPISYTKFTAYAWLNHGGDLFAAAAELAARGYRNEPSSTQPTLGIRRFTLEGLKHYYPTRQPCVLNGLLRRGEIGNVISESKSGKSWLMLQMALSVIAGRPWLDSFETTQGKVLLVDNELDEREIRPRCEEVCEAMQLPLQQIMHDLEIIPLRGQLVGLDALIDRFRNYPDTGIGENGVILEDFGIDSRSHQWSDLECDFPRRPESRTPRT